MAGPGGARKLPCTRSTPIENSTVIRITSYNVCYTKLLRSTLFNRITEAGVYAADQLFATLDPTLRKIQLDDVGPAILADTVGFIRHLPHDLVAAFKATLQETQEADILLHVVDASDDRFRENIHRITSYNVCYTKLLRATAMVSIHLRLS